jgi:hypothetical protein
MPRALLDYLAQTWTADRHRQAQRDAPARAASHARHPRPSRRAHRVRGLPAWWRAFAPCQAAAALDIGDTTTTTTPRRQHGPADLAGPAARSGSGQL